MAEINLLDEYPKLDRDVEARFREVTPEDIRVAKEFGKDFFDGPRIRGYGGYKYDGRWVKVAEKFAKHYGLTSDSVILDIGCAKGFLMHDFQLVLPGVTVIGIDVSQYALDKAMPDVKKWCLHGNARDLPFPGDFFDFVVSLATVHNLPREECKQALSEIQRVSRGKAFITVDAYRNDVEKDRLKKWVLTAETYMHVDEWKEFFAEAGYTGDYYWFIP